MKDLLFGRRSTKVGRKELLQLVNRLDLFLRQRDDRFLSFSLLGASRRNQTSVVAQRFGKSSV